LIGALSVSARRIALTMTAGRLSFRGLLRRRAIRASRVVELEVDWGRPSGRVSPLWLLIEESGRTTLALNRKAWDERRLEELRASLGLPLERRQTALRPAQARLLYPASVPWWAAHPSTATLLAIAILSALILGAGST
jgi:hypothetical protein